MLEHVVAPLAVERISRVTQPAAPFVELGVLPDATQVVGYHDLARAYKQADEPLIRSADGHTSVELSVGALGGLLDAGESCVRMLLAQSEGDRNPTLPPLAKVDHLAQTSCDEHFGLTHLHANAAVDGLALLSWLLSPGELALIVLTHQQVVAPHGVAGGRLRTGDGSVGLRVRAGHGPIALAATGHAVWSREAFASRAVFERELTADLERIRGAGFRWTGDHVIVQNLFGAGDRAAWCADVDFACGDVWHRLDERLRAGEIGAGDRVLIVATGGLRRVSYAMLDVVDRLEAAR
jgi:hypothetical protein